MIIREEIEKIIAQELLDNPAIANWHGINHENIHQHLIRPVKKKLVNPVTNALQEYWIVFDEEPKSKDKGYLIIYSEEEEAFGVATKRSADFGNVGVCLSLYDTFIDALNGM